MLEILKSTEQINESRKELGALHCDKSFSWPRVYFSARYLLRYRTLPPPVSFEKSWDVLMMLKSVLRYCPAKDAAVLDIGSYNSEIPLAILAAGYKNVTALDLNPIGRSIEWYKLDGCRIKFRCENFYESTLPPQSIDALTALSVIEHGFDPDRLFKMAAKLLKKNGLFLITTDFHEPKIGIPNDFKLFGLPYMVFSKSELKSLTAKANEFGFRLLGELHWGDEKKPSDYPINWLEKKITFAFIGFQKE